MSQLSSPRRRVCAVCACALLFTTALLAGCGDGDSSSSSSSSSSGGGADTAAQTSGLQHVEGRLALDGEGAITVTPKKGEALRLTLGPEVAAAELQALASTGQEVRAYYRSAEDPVAIAVEKAPLAPKGAKEATGTVGEVTETTLSLEAEDGDAILLTIRPEDADQFDVEHLREHADEQEPITVFYTVENGTAYALAYKDA